MRRVLPRPSDLLLYFCFKGIAHPKWIFHPDPFHYGSFAILSTLRMWAVSCSCRSHARNMLAAPEWEATVDILTENMVLL